MRDAVLAYAGVAAACGMTPLQLALRFAMAHATVGAVVGGATGVGQLRELLAAASGPPLCSEVLAAVDAVHARFPNPTP